MARRSRLTLFATSLFRWPSAESFAAQGAALVFGNSHAATPASRLPGSVLIQNRQPLSNPLLQSGLPRFHFSPTGKHSEAPTVGIVGLQQSRRIFNFGAAWEYKPDTVLFEKIEDN